MRPRPHPLFFRRKAGQKNLILCFILSLCGGVYAAQTGKGFAKDKICCFRLLVREYCSGASPPPAFLSEKSGVKELDFLFFYMSLCACVYGTQTGKGFAENKICCFCLLVRENCSGSQPPYFEYAHIDKIEHLCYNIYSRETERPTSVNRQFLSPNEGKK